MSRYVPLICLALTHAVVDTCALLVDPLWSDIETVFRLNVITLIITQIVQSMPTSITQAVFGYLRDRRSVSYWIWLGPVIAAVFLCFIGLSDLSDLSDYNFRPNRAVLYTFLIIGGIGVGAFHPEAAVTAGRLLPNNRARGLSIFMLGGALGLAVGPAVSGYLVTRFEGWHGLMFLSPVLVLIVFLLRKIGRLNEVVTTEVKSDKPALSLSQMFEGRGWLAILILMTCSLRLVPNMALNKVLSFDLADKGFDEKWIGVHQSVFLIAACTGTLMMALLFRQGWERRFMIGCPLVGIPLLAIMAWEPLPHYGFVTALILLGMVMWGTTPAMVSYAQHQFPKGAGLASALTMGLSWGLGGLIQAPITSYYAIDQHYPLGALYGFIPCLLLSMIGACLLPAMRSNEEQTTSTDEQPALKPVPQLADK